MRIWDINPGYLNRQSLLGEHRELHAVVAILRDNKTGYSRHPETLRWRGYGWALRQRHRLLTAEMTLRGYLDRSPVRVRSRCGEWPEAFVDEPCAQFAILEKKYLDREDGRIVLPKTTQQLWAHHKYSVLARDPSLYKRIGASVSNLRKQKGFCKLANELAEILRIPPPPGRLRNALQHLWGHVSVNSPLPHRDIESLPPLRFLAIIQKLAVAHREPYLMASTVLSELAAWTKGVEHEKRSHDTRRDDPFDLGRFISAQEGVYDRVIAELRDGQKRSHWMWYVFPQIDGLGHSSTTKHYSIKNIEEAKEYLNHPVLGTRLMECTDAVLATEGRSASEIFGYPDDLKLKSCMTLFETVAGPDSVYHRILEKYFGGQKDARTLQLIAKLK